MANKTNHQKRPNNFWASNKTKGALLTAALGIIVCYIRANHKHKLDCKKQSKEQQGSEALAQKKHEHRLIEEDVQFQNQLKIEESKHEKQIEQENLKFDHKRELIRIKNNGGSFEDTVPQGLLPSENFGELVNSPLSPSDRIKLLEYTPIQNRDIFVLYGTAGLGKTTVLMQMMSMITTGQHPYQLIPTSNGIVLPYQGMYYDLEMNGTEWKEKNGGRKDLYRINRIGCRGKSADFVLADIRERLVQNAGGNYIIALDPISKFGLKKKQISPFIDSLAKIQEQEFERGRNITFVLVAHPVKAPRGKMLEDLGGAKEWFEFVKTVVSFMPIGEKDKYRKLTFEKAKNGNEFARGEVFIQKQVQEPYYHFEYDEALTEEYKTHHTVNGYHTVSAENKPRGKQHRNPKRRGKISKVPPEIRLKIQRLRDVEKYTAKQIADTIGKPYKLHPIEVDRLVHDVREDIEREHLNT